VAFTLIATETFDSAYGPYTSVSTDNALNIAAGDLIVVGVGMSRDAADPTVTSITDGGDNTCTLESVIKANLTFGQSGYILSTAAHADAIFTVTLNNAARYVNIRVFQFRPTAGYVAIKDQNIVSAHNDWAANPVTGNITTTADDVVLVAGARTGGAALSSQAISGSAVTVVDTVGWYRISTAAETTHADATCTTTEWVIWLASFKSQAAAGGGVNTKIVSYYMARRRN
jgi:hypothetical protein